VASHGIPLDTYRAVEKGAVGAGAGGMALEEDRLVVIEDYRDHSSALPGLTKLGVRSAAAAPIRQDGKPVGSLMVASIVAGRRYRDTERAALIAFAEHASLAVSDAGRTRQMLHSALHDALTGLPNRLLFSDRLDQRLVGGRRTRPPTAVLFLDVDALKRINDSLGHLVGDEVLVETARRLSATVRTEDTVARLAGDEFTVLLDEITGESEALAVAGRLLEAVRQPIAAGGRRLSLTASIGVRLARAGVDRAADVMRGADLAMYEAKARGGGAVALFHRDLDQRAVRRLELEGELRAAMEVGEFRVLYQPIHCLGSGRPVGAEALVRWEHPDRGLIGPGEFIALAEETGLFVSIGTQVLREACRQARTWEEEDRRLAIKVNLSARQFIHPNLAGVVAEILAETGIDPALVYLEITETVLMEDVESTSGALTELKSLGVSLTVDDFGTGYSSLAYLKRFPVDELKIDRDFVAGLLTDQEDSAIVAAIINLAHTLGVVAVAEGVETAEQVQRLRELGCDLGQGYHFGRPLPAEDLTSRLSLAAGPAEPVPATHVEAGG